MIIISQFLVSDLNLVWGIRSFMGFQSGASNKELSCQFRRHKRRGFNPRVRRSPGGGHGNPLQHSLLEHPMDREAWQAVVHKITKSWTQLKRLSTHAHCKFYIIFTQNSISWQISKLHK